MKSPFIPDLQNSSDSDFGTFGNEIFASFAPWVSYNGGNPLANVPLGISPPAPALASQTVISSPGQGTPNSVVAVTTGGITINLLFDAAAMAAPSSFRAGIQQAASLLTASISDKITVNINIDYHGTGGGAFAGPDQGQFESYSSIRADLINNATQGDSIFDSLPTGSSIQGQSSVSVWNAQLKLFGLLGANDIGTDDGSATFATDIDPNLLVGVALHELTHALGRIPDGPQPDIFDLFRFTSAGTRLFTSGATAPAAFFSVDGGNTKLADFGQTSDSSDFLNSGVQGANDPFNEFYNGKTLQSLTTVDKQLLDALGFHTSPVTVIEASGSTSLVQVNNNYFLDAIGSGSGPELKSGGVASVAGQFGGSWTPIGAEQTSTGYDVAFKNTSTNQYTVWSTDSNGNYIANVIGAVSGTDAGLESLETTFHQDLNGDGVIGVPATVIEAFGSTSLVQVGNNYFLDAIGSGSGPELKSGGVASVAGQFGGSWTPIGAEQTSTGYDVAFKNTSTNQYTVWSTDSNGNYIANVIGAVSGTDAGLESLETTFHQDLNGDGVIGVPATVIEAFGSTSLVQVGNNYFLDAIGSGSGPELKSGGVASVAGQFGGSWTPIGAEQTSTGYDVAFKNTSTNQYTVWSTDSNGNYIANVIGAVSGTDAGLESLETTFHQDLNGDGVIGVPATVIEAFGSTSLVQVGNNYFLDAIGSGSGPELKSGGVASVAGQFGGSWTPIGAEQTSTGYDVAFKNTSTNQYTVWSTDSNGNYIANVIGAVSGTDAGLESLETTFHQDLNGDGVIGVPATVIEAFGSTSLVQVGNNYFLDAIGSGSGPELKSGGVASVAGQFGGSWTPIGAEQTSTGYDVAFKNTSTNQYTVWSTDSNGNYIANVIGAVSGTDAGLESLETTFHQDLNGDGVIGVPASHTGPTLELAGVSSNLVTFAGSPSILILDTPSIFSGQVFGFSGDGTLTGSDQVDLRGMNYNSIHSSFDSSTGRLDVNDGTRTADLQFLGNYSNETFKFADDGSGGVIVYASSTSNQPIHPGAAGAAAAGLAGGSGPGNISPTAGQDTFVFAPNFGQVTLANFSPATDTIQISQSIFANTTALLAATHDDAHGNAVITDAAHDTITIQQTTAAQLLTHQSDFHFV